MSDGTLWNVGQNAAEIETYLLHFSGCVWNVGQNAAEIETYLLHFSGCVSETEVLKTYFWPIR